MIVTVSLWWIAILVVLLLGVAGWFIAGDKIRDTGGQYDFSGAFRGLARLFVAMCVAIGLLAIFAIKGCVGW